MFLLPSLSFLPTLSKINFKQNKKTTPLNLKKNTHTKTNSCLLLPSRWPNLSHFAGKMHVIFGTPSPPFWCLPNLFFFPAVKWKTLPYAICGQSLYHLCLDLCPLRRKFALQTSLHFLRPQSIMPPSPIFISSGSSPFPLTLSHLRFYIKRTILVTPGH